MSLGTNIKLESMNGCLVKKVGVYQYNFQRNCTNIYLVSLNTEVLIAFTIVTTTYKYTLNISFLIKVILHIQYYQPSQKIERHCTFQLYDTGLKL